MAKFQMKELIGTEPITARLGAGSGSANYVTDVEIGKPVKMVGDSQYGLCAVVIRSKATSRRLKPTLLMISRLVRCKLQGASA